MQLMWVCGTTVCALRVNSEYLFANLERIWIAEVTVGVWFVVCSSDDGIRTH